MAKLKIVPSDDEEPSRTDIFMAGIFQSWREWTPAGWKPVNDPQKQETLLVDEIQAKSYKVIIADTPIPWTRMLLRLIQSYLAGVYR